MVAPSQRSLGTVLKTSTGTPTFSAPAGAASSDIIVVFWFQDDGRTSVGTPPTGFSAPNDAPQRNDAAAGSPSHSLNVYWGRFSDVGAGPWAFTVVPGIGSATPFCEGRAAAYQDCITSGNPFEAADGNTSGASNTATAPAVSATSAGNDRLAVYMASNWAGGAWTEPSGYTEDWDGDDRIVTLDHLTMPTAATTSPQAVNASSNRMNAWVGILKPAGGTTFTQSVSGATTPTGTVVKTAARRLTGTTTPTGTLLKLTARLLGGTTTPTGTLRRQPGKALGGTVSPAGTVRRTIAKTLTGATAPAGAVRKLIARLLGGSTTPTGAATAQTVVIGNERTITALAEPRARWRTQPPRGRWTADEPRGR